MISTKEIKKEKHQIEITFVKRESNPLSNTDQVTCLYPHLQKKKKKKKGGGGGKGKKKTFSLIIK